MITCPKCGNKTIESLGKCHVCGTSTSLEIPLWVALILAAILLFVAIIG